MFDQSGNLQATYTQTIERLKQSISSTVQSMMNALNSTLEQERMNVSNAASNASSSIGGVLSASDIANIVGDNTGTHPPKVIQHPDK